MFEKVLKGTDTKPIKNVTTAKRNKWKRETGKSWKWGKGKKLVLGLSKKGSSAFVV